MRDTIDDFLAHRANYFRDNFRRLLWITLSLMALATFLLLWALYQKYIESPSSFYVTTSNGDLIHLIPADTPYDAVVGKAIVPTEDV